MFPKRPKIEFCGEVSQPFCCSLKVARIKKIINYKIYVVMMYYQILTTRFKRNGLN